MSSVWPTELRVQNTGKTLSVAFDDGGTYALDAEYLRVESPSAEVQGHSPQERKLISGKRAVKIAGVEPVGNYAVKLVFDDGHSTGIYTWPYLETLGRERETKWATYLDALKDRGLTREPGLQLLDLGIPKSGGCGSGGCGCG